MADMACDAGNPPTRCTSPALHRAAPGRPHRAWRQQLNLNTHCALAGTARDPASLRPARDDVVAVEALVLDALVAQELAQPLRRGHRAALAACARMRR